MAGDVFIFCFSLFTSSVDCYVIHIDCDVHSIDEVSEYGVHHSLEGGRGVGQAKEHDCGFKEPFVRNKGRFPPVFLFDEDLIVPPFDVHSCK